MRLNASTLLETVVSSLVFMIVFALALGAASRINRISNPAWDEMEQAFNERRALLRIMESGQIEYEYSWGKLSFEAGDAYLGLVPVTMTATMRDGQKVVYKFYADEDESL